ncbi:hypothetical protein [Crossiella sp. CA198]|uniref:hypothetical protein n=1 Tax=Crossiella sp. CA198 TaxID=3455607 RepID=UPI003F8D8C87
MSSKTLPASNLSVGTWIRVNGKNYQISGIEPDFGGQFNGRYQEFDYMVHLRGGPSMGVAYNTTFTVTNW